MLLPSNTVCTCWSIMGMIFRKSTKSLPHVNFAGSIFMTCDKWGVWYILKCVTHVISQPFIPWMQNNSQNTTVQPLSLSAMENESYSTSTGSVTVVTKYLQCVRLLHLLAVATLQMECLFNLEPSIVRLLFEGGDCWGWHLFKEILW